MVTSILVAVIIYIIFVVKMWPGLDMGRLGLILLQAPVAGMVCGLITGLLCVIGGIACHNLVHYERVDIVQHNIVALKDNNGLHGSFFIGSGQINDKMVYTYMEKDGEAMTMHTLDVGSAKIYEDADSTSAYIIEYRLCPREAIKYFFIFPGGSKQHYELHVPKNSVKVGYNIDLE